MNTLGNSNTLYQVDPDKLRTEILHELLAGGGWSWCARQPNDVWKSPQLWQLLGYAPKRTGLPAVFIRQLVATTEVDAVQNGLLRLVSGELPSLVTTFSGQHYDESTRWIRLRATYLTESKQFVASFTDVTTQHDYDELLRDSTRLARVGGWTLNVRTKKITWTPVTREIHQVPPDFEPDFENGIQFYQPGYSRDRITKVVTEACHHGTPYDEELQLTTYTGKTIWVRAIGRAEFRNGECVRLYGILQDIHEKKMRERQQARLSVLEARNREVEKFAYITSHDLRQPVRTVLSYCELLKEDFESSLDAEALRYIEVIGQAAEHMDSLILGILEHSRLGRPKDLQMVDGNRLLANVLNSIDSLVRERGARIELSRELPKFWGYPVELALLWQNLLENAIKFSRPGTAPYIWIDLNKVDGGWQFTVSDNGIGIAPQDQKKIFGFFRRLHTQDNYEGYGIGLAHCKKIVELHFGNIWVTSRPENGSQFHFTILTDEAGAAIDQESTSSIKP